MAVAELKEQSNPSPEQDLWMVETIVDLIKEVKRCPWEKKSYQGEAVYYFQAKRVYSAPRKATLRIVYAFFPERSRTKFGGVGACFHHIGYEHIQLACGGLTTKTAMIKSPRFWQALAHELVHALDSFRLGGLAHGTHGLKPKAYERHGYETNARILSSMAFVVESLQGHFVLIETNILDSLFPALVADGFLAKSDKRSFYSRMMTLAHHKR
jgi:hypothetical protein